MQVYRLKAMHASLGGLVLCFAIFVDILFVDILFVDSLFVGFLGSTWLCSTSSEHGEGGCSASPEVKTHDMDLEPPYTL